MDYFTESVLRPVIKTKIESKDEFLSIFRQMQDTINSAISNDDEAYDEVLEHVLMRIMDCGALVSREHDFLGSTKEDADFLMAQSTLGGSSLYSSLLADSDYAALAAQH